MNTHVDATSMPIVAPHLDPDYQHEQSMREEAREAAIVDYVADWCAGYLPYDGITDPLQALIDNEPGLLQQLVGDFRTGDAAELEQSTGVLARAIIKYVEEQAERVML